jgi:hypothetical protein
VNESDWLTSNDPIALLRHVVQSGVVSERKVRLLACACCRQIWEWLPDPRSRAAVEVAERFADEQATPRELARARNEALAVGGGASWAPYWATNSKASGPLRNVFEAAAAAPARAAVQRATDHRADAWYLQQSVTLAEQVALIREVIGNPFRDVPLDPMWLAYDDGIVVRLAEGIYQDGAFDRMPILGDALEEAGCAVPELLAHCREPAKHVRGCWLLDALTGRV